MKWEITPASETYLLMFQSEKHLSVNHRFDIRHCQIKEDGWVFGNSLFSSLVVFVNHIILLICAMAINDSSKLWFFLRIGVLLLFRVAILTWWVIKVVIGQPSNHTEHPRSNIKQQKTTLYHTTNSYSPYLIPNISICSFRSIDEFENLLFKFALNFWVFHPSFKGSDISGL